MLNNVVLVGRLVNEPTIEDLGEGKTVTTVTLAVTRNFKNDDGEYEIDYIPCVLWRSVASTTKEYCHKGDVIGVKGRLQSTKMASGNVIDVVAERVTFLSSNKKGNE